MATGLADNTACLLLLATLVFNVSNSLNSHSTSNSTQSHHGPTNTMQIKIQVGTKVISIIMVFPMFNMRYSDYLDKKMNKYNKNP